MPSTIVWIQKWEEHERGWGIRPDGFTIHQRKEDVATFLKDIRDREAKDGYGAGNAPDEYSSPCGDPYQTEIKDPIILAQLAESGDGIWGKGNEYPSPLVPGQDKTGWCSVDIKPQPKTLGEELQEIKTKSLTLPEELKTHIRGTLRKNGHLGKFHFGDSDFTHWTQIYKICNIKKLLAEWLSEEGLTVDNRGIEDIYVTW